MIVINLQKAKEIIKQNIRVERIPLLEQLDIMYIRALENNNINEQQRIIQKKQYLRDLPNSPILAGASSIEELQNFNPLYGINLYE